MIVAMIPPIDDPKVAYDTCICKHVASSARPTTKLSGTSSRAPFPLRDHRHRPIQRDVLELAIKAAAKVEKRRGRESLGPRDDFEWGMVNGKLSALRWVLGDEWDMLDT
jgi:hypothetical protein